MDKEERESLKNEIVEQIFLQLPEIIGNLMTSQASLNKLNKKLYSENPDFKNHKEIVVKVLEEVEGENPGKSYEDMIRIAVPKIKKMIGITSELNVKDVKHPGLGISYNGAL